jgi:hypothetical protein
MNPEKPKVNWGAVSLPSLNANSVRKNNSVRCALTLRWTTTTICERPLVGAA